MIVSKATSVYTIMIVVLVGGLWLILALGSTLIPPTDLAGRWEWAGPAGTQSLSVEQSGKFVDLAMGPWTRSLKIQADGKQGSQPSDRVVLNAKGQTVTFEGLGLNDQCTIQFEGEVTGSYRAHRVFKAFK